jgi:hypothetical protein
MSWHCLLEPVAASSEECCSDTVVLERLKLSHTLDKSYCNGNETEYYHRSQSGIMCAPSGPTIPQPDHILNGSERRCQGNSLLAAGSRNCAKTFQPPEKEQESPENDLDCGPSSPESLARYNPRSRSWKTRQCLLAGGLESYSETWPRWGMMRDGELYPLKTPVLHTSAKESGSLPTPAAQWRGVAGTGNTNKLTKILGDIDQNCLTPGQMEWLMDWPTKWTEKKPLAMGRFQAWLRSHGRY